MIDLETLGTHPGCPVVSLGAVFFDIKTKTLGPKVYMVLDISDQIEKGRKPTGETLYWWLSQSDGAKSVFKERTNPVADVLKQFIQWYGQTDAYVWGNGATFDISILENLFRHYGMKAPWPFTKVMDLRTFRRFTGAHRSIQKIGTAHNALDDAISQATYVMENL